MSRRPLQTAILLRVAPATIGMLLLVLGYTRFVVTQTLSEEVRQRVRQTASLLADHLASELVSLQASADSLASNDLIVNSLVDREQRESQLGPFFRTLRMPNPAFTSVTLTDYRGRAIASSDSTEFKTDPTQLTATVMAGQSCRRLDHDRAVFASPVRYAGRPEGMIVIEYDMRSLLDRLRGVPAVSDATRIRLVQNEIELYNSIRLEERNASWDRDTAANSDNNWSTCSAYLDSQLCVEYGERIDAAFAASRSLDRFLTGVLLVSAAGILFSIWSAARMARAPLQRLIDRIAKIRSAPDLSDRVNITGPLEFQRLTEAFNLMLADLAATTVSRDRLQESELKLRDANRLLARSNEELEQFAYVASHDLQEPLRKVAAFCGVLEEDCGEELSEDAKQYMEYIVDGASRMQKLIQDLLSFSRIDSQGKELSRVDCNQVVATALERLSQSIEESDAEVTVGDLPHALADDVQLSQVFQNLVQNALKYCEDRPKLAIEAEVDEQECVISVRDNGIGIDQHHRHRVFGVFKRLHNRSQYSGTGIGLALCKRIIERMNGRIWVEAAEGGGSVFRFTLKAPAESTADSPPAESTADSLPANEDEPVAV